MYYIFSILAGVLIAVMIVANGELGVSFGTYASTAIIHLVGLVLISVIYLSKKRSVKSRKKLPLYLYLGGFLGVGTIVFNNMAFGKISVSAILALGLLGQSISAILIDQFGLFNMPKAAFSKRKLIGLSFVVLGIFIMVTLKDAAQIGAIILALLTGLTVILSRTVNARLAEEKSLMYSTLFNYIIGTATAIIILLIAGRGEPLFTGMVIPTNIWLYTGGIIGVFTIMLLNLTVTKISSFYMTLTLFVGQVFTGIVIDMLLTGSFSSNNLLGGILVAVGLSLNVFFDRTNQNIKAEKDVQAIPESAS